VTKTIEVRPLAKDDDRSGLSCGQPDLDRFFEYYAGQNQFKLRLAVTYIALAQARIVGFATVATSSVERASVPSARLRKRLPTYPLPVRPRLRRRRGRARGPAPRQAGTDVLGDQDDRLRPRRLSR